MTLDKDTILEGHTGLYRIIKPLGRAGATARAYLLQRDEDGDQFALKLMRPGIGPEMKNKFIDEMTVLQQLSRSEEILGQCHIPRIAECSALDEAKTRALFQHLNTPFIIMDLAEGDPVESLLEEEYVFSEHEAVMIMSQFARVLLALHRAKLTYADMKLGNLFWDRENRHLMVIDWNVVGKELVVEAAWDRFRAATFFFQMATGIQLAVKEDSEQNLKLKNLEFRRMKPFLQLSEGTRAFLIEELRHEHGKNHSDSQYQIETTKAFKETLEAHAERFDLSAKELLDRGNLFLKDQLWRKALFDLDMVSRFHLHQLKGAQNPTLEQDLALARREAEKLGRRNYYSGVSRWKQGLLEDALDDFERAMSDDPFHEEARLFAIFTRLGQKLEPEAFKKKQGPALDFLEAVMGGHWDIAITALKAMDLEEHTGEVNALKAEIYIRRALDKGATYLQRDALEKADLLFKEAFQRGSQLLYPEEFEVCHGRLNDYYARVKTLKEHWNKGATYLQREDYRKAVAEFRAVESLTQGSLKARERLHKAVDLAAIQDHCLAKDFQSAHEKLERLPPEHLPDEALKRLKERVLRGYLDQLRQWSLAARKRGEYDLEQKHLHQILEIVPDDPAAQSALKRSIRDSQKELFDTIERRHKKLGRTRSVETCNALIQAIESGRLFEDEKINAYKTNAETLRAKILEIEAAFERAIKNRDIDEQMEALNRAISERYELTFGPPLQLKEELSKHIKNLEEELKQIEQAMGGKLSEKLCTEMIKKLQGDLRYFPDSSSAMNKLENTRAQINELQVEYHQSKANKELIKQRALLKKAATHPWILEEGDAEVLSHQLEEKISKIQTKIEGYREKFYDHDLISVELCERSILMLQKRYYIQFEVTQKLIHEISKIKNEIIYLNQRIEKAEMERAHCEDMIELLKEPAQRKWVITHHKEKIPASKALAHFQDLLKQSAAKCREYEKGIEKSPSFDLCQEIIEEWEGDHHPTRPFDLLKRRAKSILAEMRALEKMLERVEGPEIFREQLAALDHKAHWVLPSGSPKALRRNLEERYFLHSWPLFAKAITSGANYSQARTLASDMMVVTPSPGFKENYNSWVTIAEKMEELAASKSEDKNSNPFQRFFELGLVWPGLEKGSLVVPGQPERVSCRLANKSPLEPMTSNIQKTNNVRLLNAEEQALAEPSPRSSKPEDPRASPILSFHAFVTELNILLDWLVNLPPKGVPDDAAPADAIRDQALKENVQKFLANGLNYHPWCQAFVQEFEPKIELSPILAWLVWRSKDKMTKNLYWEHFASNPAQATKKIETLNEDPAYMGWKEGLPLIEKTTHFLETNSDIKSLTLGKLDNLKIEAEILARQLRNFKEIHFTSLAARFEQWLCELEEVISHKRKRESEDLVRKLKIRFENFKMENGPILSTEGMEEIETHLERLKEIDETQCELFKSQFNRQWKKIQERADKESANHEQYVKLVELQRKVMEQYREMEDKQLFDLERALHGVRQKPDYKTKNLFLRRHISLTEKIKEIESGNMHLAIEQYYDLRECFGEYPIINQKIEEVKLKQNRNQMAQNFNELRSRHNKNRFDYSDFRARIMLLNKIPHEHLDKTQKKEYDKISADINSSRVLKNIVSKEDYINFLDSGSNEQVEAFLEAIQWFSKEKHFFVESIKKNKANLKQAVFTLFEQKSLNLNAFINARWFLNSTTVKNIS